MANTTEMEAAIIRILYNIWLFKPLLKYDLFVITPLIVVLFLFLSGLIMSIFLGILYIFLKIKILYLLLLAIFSALVAFQWYLKNYPKLLVSIFPIFRATENEYISKLKETKIVHKNFVLVIASFTIALYGIISVLIKFLSRSEMGVTFILSDIPFNNFIHIYIIVLIGICGIILGTGILGYLESIWMISKICQYEIDITKVYLLNELTRFNTIFTFFGVFAISLFVVLVSDNFTVMSLFLGGTIIVMAAFSYPQVCFHFSIVKSRNRDLEIITNLYGIYYNKLLETEELNDQGLKDLDYLRNIRKDIEKTKTFFYDFDSILKLITASLLPSLTLWIISKL